ncbi:hypothetical protein CC1G_06182 [Coprinopsis cinerea okayama7|uniref:Uncharacterized protein n=1 Tax=Coprinopsis cinerea (strain Okayama-7 / 130 / ATCC MYA-4618 / FGSC 9003) TaxID=240176 RepID=A8NV42_COPC7|nr:hypothetical protein CC1G_06182 [Coprinopsis cinerea okayama7\|eukprot:XP_001836595.2 hypothetical protein CC1G_06182 [Coprinopsis cinerea okayama7\
MSISNPQNHQFPQEGTLSLAVNLDGSQPAADTPAEPVKRRPGRPKGSTKKNLLGTPISPTAKVKRPVGRPRKDGMPAGSVGPTRLKRERQAGQPQQPFFMPPQGVENGFPYPPTVGMYPAPVPFQVPPPPIIQIDPSLSGDEWATMSRNDPNGFLSVLLGALAAPNPVSTAGPSVEDAFKNHLQSLAPSPTQVQQIPTLYSILKTFWLPSSPAYFSLTASASTARIPSEHRFLYWDPLPLVFNGIGCPVCGHPLTHKGRITTGPIKIYDIEKPFFIIGCEYACKSVQCLTSSSPDGRKFASTDSSILRSLPVKLKDEFPARLLCDDSVAGCGPNVWNWRALGVSRSLWSMVVGGLRMGLKREVILHLVHSIQHGVPEVELQKQEGQGEEGQGMPGHSMQEGQGSQQSDSQGHGMDQPEQPPPGFSDQYGEAWKENSVSIQDPQQQQQQQVKSPPPPVAGSSSQPSVSVTAPPPPPQPNPVASPPNQVQAPPPPPPPAFSYQPYPFTPYGYMAPPMVNGQVVHLTPGGQTRTCTIPTTRFLHSHSLHWVDLCFRASTLFIRDRIHRSTHYNNDDDDDSDEEESEALL